MLMYKRHKLCFAGVGHYMARRFPNKNGEAFCLTIYRFLFGFFRISSAYSFVFNLLSNNRFA